MTSSGATAKNTLSCALNFERSVRDTLTRARDQQRHNMGQMAPSAALREEPGSDSPARGRPQFILRDLA